MENKKIRICIFLHYSVTKVLPYNVEIYIQELSRHFDKVIVLSNNDLLDADKQNLNSNIEFEYFENRGYDFGMFYRFIINEKLDKYSQIAIVNDSNFLLKKLDHIFYWANTNDFDFWGLVDSIEGPHFSKHKNNYHIQSHFIVLNQKAINLLPSFLESLNVDGIIKEENVKKLRHNVINDWEIGLSQFFIKNNLKIASFIDSKKMISKYHPKKVNVTFSLFHELIADENYPLMKKKLATMKKKWYKLNKNMRKDTLIKYCEKEWDVKKIVNEIS